MFKISQSFLKYNVILRNIKPNLFNAGHKYGTVLYSSSASTQNSINTQLYLELKKWRKITAEEQHKPPYMVFRDATLQLIVTQRPSTLVEFENLSGVGPKTLNYAESVLEIVRKYPLPLVNPNSPIDSNSILDTAVWEVKPKRVVKKRKPKDENIIADIEVQMPTSRTKRKRIYITELSDEQKVAANKAIAGNNLFITGSAGTGKSFLLNYVIQELQKLHGEASVAVTAPTGVAAINIGGQTVHSFSGIGFGKGDHKRLLEKVVTTTVSYDRWLKTKVLIIDEISMLDRSLFELLSDIGKEIKKNELPFGGIQIIVVGDFLQLPPVQDGADRKFCFQSEIWEEAGLLLPTGNILLKEIVRQTDKSFIKLLNEIRIGNLPDDMIALLDACVVGRKALPVDGIIPTKLYCINKDVDSENAEKLAELEGDLVKLLAVDEWKIKNNPSKKRMLLEIAEKTIPKEIDLKLGAQVMLLRNRNRVFDNSGSSSGFLGLVNGSRGKIIGFTTSSVDDEEVPIVKFDNGKILTIGRAEYEIRSPDGDGLLTRRQIPLKLAWYL